MTSSTAVDKSTVLVTSVGSDSARELVECLEPLRSRIRVVGTNLYPDAPALFRCDAAYLAPVTAERAAFRARLEEIVAAERPRLVFAGRDEDLEALTAMAADPGHAGICFLVPPSDLVPVCNDKLATARFAQAHGLSFAASAAEPEAVWALVERCGLPVIAKPRWIGHASKDVYVMTSAEQVRTALGLGTFVFQEYLAIDRMSRSCGAWRTDLGVPISWALEDEGYAVNLAIGRDGQVLRSMIAATLRLGPRVSRMWVEDQPAVAEVAAGYAATLAARGYRGSLNLQGKLLAGRGFVVFEINGRVVGSATARAMLGFNLPAMLVAHYLWDEPVEVPAATAPGDLPEICRMLSSHPVPRQGIETLRRAGRWFREPAALAARGPG